MITRTILAAAFVALSLPALAEVKVGECLFETEGDVWADGLCQYEISAGGSWEAHALQASAIVIISDGIGDGAIMGLDNVPLPTGYLTRAGACWVNDHVKLCVWAMGTRNR